MSELLPNNPVFTMMMGCNGAGKSAWKRANYDALPSRYIDQDSIAGGFGDWEDPSNRERIRPIVDREINDWIENKLDFGMESSFSGFQGVSLMDRVIAEGYVVKGIYMGTNDPSINIERIEYRVIMNTGHRVDLERIPHRHAHSLSNLRKKWGEFEELILLDNSSHNDLDKPLPVEQCYVQRGVVQESIPREEMADWASTLLNRIDEASREGEKQHEIERRKRERGLER